MTNKEIQIDIFDTTLRDGAQSLPVENQFAQGDKVYVARQLGDLGVGVIEAGFPATPSDFDEVVEVARTVGNEEFSVGDWNSTDINVTRSATYVPVVAGLSRTLPTDLDITWDAISAAKRPRIHTFVSTDEAHMRAKFPGKSSEDVRKMGISAVRYAKSLSEGNPLSSVEFSAEAATTTESSYLERVIKDAVDEGVDVINVPDTVGEMDPFAMYKFYAGVISWVHSINPDVVISAHNHNDMGMATANTFSLVKAASDYSFSNSTHVKIQAETTVCGLGERAGNTDVIQFVGNLFKFGEDLKTPAMWQFNPGQAVVVAKNVMSRIGSEVHRQTPFVGSDINTHRSGIHSDGIIKGGVRIYTPFEPMFWGHKTDSVHEDGKYQGKRGRQVAISTAN